MNDAKRAKIEQAYVAAHLTATELLEEISGLVQDLPAPDDDRPLHWGHVGDLQHINHQLLEVLVFLKRGIKV